VATSAVRRSGDVAEPCCEHCITRLGFGPRRKRILLLLTHHPELDQEEFVGQLVADTDRGGRVRGSVHEKVLLPPVEVQSPAREVA
jgi:hypothetical protein